jgi:hypothetical protein
MAAIATVQAGIKAGVRTLARRRSHDMSILAPRDPAVKPPTMAVYLVAVSEKHVQPHDGLSASSSASDTIRGGLVCSPPYSTRNGRTNGDRSLTPVLTG